jgi:hypothetical protein
LESIEGLDLDAFCASYRVDGHGRAQRPARQRLKSRDVP